MLLTACSSALEAALNTWLTLDAKTHGQALQQLKPLQGKLIALRIIQPDLTFYIVPQADSVRVTTHYAAIPDVTITGSALAFMHLTTAEDAGKAMLQQGIQLEGDSALGQCFSHILRASKVDWEELLSRVVGDVVAHQLGQTARQTNAWLSESAQTMRLNGKEYLQEEVRLLAADAELQHYLDEVDQLRLDVDRLEARLHLLEGKQAAV